MRFMNRPALGPTLAFALAFITGCHEIGHMGDTPADIYGGGQDSEIVGEVRGVNTKAQEIDVRTEDRRVRNVRYDNRTRVIYRQRDYEVGNLEPGDYVAIRARYDSYSSTPYADLIRVQQSVQERGGTNAPRARLERLDGTVEFVDARRGVFELRERDRRRVIVSMPYNPPRSELDRFRRLREGDHVQVEGRFLNPERFELEAFL